MKWRYLMLLGLSVLLSGTGRANAEMLTLTVYAGAGTGGLVIFQTIGDTTTVTADMTALNSALDATDFGAYQFTSLSGSSNNPGTDSSQGSFVSLSGIVNVNPGGPGAGRPFTITLTEGGFTLPSGSAGSSLATSATANYTETSAALVSTQSDYSVFTDSTPMMVTGQTVTLPSNGTGSDSHSGNVSQPLGAFVTPYTLENVLTLTLDANSGTALGMDQFTGTTNVVPGASPSAAPEPASLLLLGMGGLSFAVYGWRRRKQSVPA